jgi:drug/metabolite transporter (DMT)-like permease
VRRGPLYITIAGLMFTIMLALIKIARAELDTFEILMWRGITAAPLAYALARPVGLRLHRPGLFALRAGFGTVAMFCFVYAAKGLLVADLTLIHQTQPLMLTALAPLVLGRNERASPLVWLVLMVGLGGGALILAPELAIGSVYGIAAFGAALGSTCAHLCVSALMRSDDARVVVFHFQTSVTVVGVVAIVIATGEPPALPSSHMWLPVLGIGVFATLGQVFMTQAYAEDRASVVAAASYSTPIWAILADIVIFAAVPGWNVLAGGAVVIATGLFLLFFRFSR